MLISLKTLLQTGFLGELRLGMSVQQVRKLLGEPDAVGNTSRKHRTPSLYLYGTVEFWLRQQPPHDLVGIYWEVGDKGELKMPTHCRVVDWELIPGMKREEVEAFLTANQIGFEKLTNQPVDTLRLPGGVDIIFDEEGVLWSVCVSSPREA